LVKKRRLEKPHRLLPADIAFTPGFLATVLRPLSLAFMLSLMDQLRNGRARGLPLTAACSVTEQ
jgi:hypothetical protein